LALESKSEKTLRDVALQMLIAREKLSSLIQVLNLFAPFTSYWRLRIVPRLLRFLAVREEELLHIRHLRRTLLPAIVVCTVAPTAHASLNNPTETEASRPELAGQIADPSGAIVPGATLELSEANGTNHTSTADASGHYSFSGLPQGSYTLVVNAPGFASQTISNVVLGGPQSVLLNIKLVIETAQQDVQVSQDAATDTSPDRNADAITIKGSALDMLSADTSQMQQELQAMAGATGDGGSSMYVDGFSNGKMPPKNTIREIRINQNPFSAEYEEQGSNRIQIFTKPGSDTFHAEATAYGTDSAFDSQNPFTTQPQPFHSWNLDADANGPLGKKTSFLVGIRLNSLANIAVVNAVGLDANNNQTPLTAAVEDPTDYNGTSVKIDRQVSINNTLTARIDYGHQNQSNASVGQLQLASQGYNMVNNFTVLQISDTQIYGPKIVNETRFQYQRSRSAQTPLTNAPALVVEGAFTGGGSALGHITDNLDQYELQNYATFDLGKHFLRAGIRERINREANSSTANYNGEYIFPTLSAYQTAEQQIAAGATSVAGASQFNITAGDPSATVLLADTAVFAEDTWKATKKLTASYGLRFETQNHLVGEHDLAPRLALTYNIGGTDKKPPMLVLQSGFGIFYSRFPIADLLQATRLNGVSQSQYVVTNPAFYPNIPLPSSLSGAGQVPPTLYRIGDTYRSPYALHYATSLAHNFGQAGTVTLGYRAYRQEHLLLTHNINAPLPGTYNPNDPTSGVRPFGTLQNINEYDTEGLKNSNHVYLNSHIHTKVAEIFANYNFGNLRSDTSGNFPMNQYNVREDYGRDTQDARHRLFLGEFFHLPYGVSGGTFLIAQSGTPFDIVLGNDLNGDSQFNDRPSFATDLTRASVVSTHYGNFDTNPIAGQTIIPHNYAQGPGLLQLNASVRKSLQFGPEVKPAADAPEPVIKPGQKPPKLEKKYTLEAGVWAENILNHVNPAPPVGTLGSPLFGRSNALNSTFSEGSANRQLLFILGFQF
jgi:hypothetical protein